jgi:hypothetical protein
MDSSAKQVYLDKVSENYKAEAEECLRREFNDWLQGKHKANQLGDFGGEKYVNQPGKPVRRQTYRIGDEVIAAVKDDWRHTWWGAAQLTHLPGVRDYLRRNAMEVAKADVYMNLLAEHGPQDLESAWMYFKHWVKGRPLSDSADMCDQELYGPGTRSDFGPHNPIEEIYAAQQHKGRELDIIATRIGRAAGRRSETVRALSLGGEVSKSRLLPKEQQEQQELDELRALSAQPPNTPPPPADPPPDLQTNQRVNFAQQLEAAQNQLQTVTEAEEIVELTEEEQAKLQESKEQVRTHQEKVEAAMAKLDAAKNEVSTFQRVFGRTGLLSTPPGKVLPYSSQASGAPLPFTPAAPGARAPPRTVDARFFYSHRNPDTNFVTPITIDSLNRSRDQLAAERRVTVETLPIKPETVGLPPLRTGATMPKANVPAGSSTGPAANLRVRSQTGPQGVLGAADKGRGQKPMIPRAEGKQRMAS